MPGICLINFSSRRGKKGKGNENEIKIKKKKGKKGGKKEKKKRLKVKTERDETLEILFHMQQNVEVIANMRSKCIFMRGSVFFCVHIPNCPFYYK